MHSPFFSSASFFACCAKRKWFHHAFRFCLAWCEGGSWACTSCGGFAVMGGRVLPRVRGRSERERPLERGKEGVGGVPDAVFGLCGAGGVMSPAGTSAVLARRRARGRKPRIGLRRREASVGGPVRWSTTSAARADGGGNRRRRGDGDDDDRARRY